MNLANVRRRARRSTDDLDIYKHSFHYFISERLVEMAVYEV